jgi:hypothetical protein
VRSLSFEKNHGAPKGSDSSTGQTSSKFSKESVLYNVADWLRKWFFWVRNLGAWLPKREEFTHFVGCIEYGRLSHTGKNLPDRRHKTVTKDGDRNVMTARVFRPADLPNRYSSRCAPPDAWQT